LQHTIKEHSTMGNIKSKIVSQVSFINEAKSDLRKLLDSTALSWLQPLAIMSVLLIWISSCKLMASEFTSTAITCSLIIVCLLFFKSAEQKGDYNKKD